MPNAESEGYEEFQEVNMVLSVSEKNDTKDSRKTPS